MAARCFTKAVNLNALSAELYKNYGISLLKLGNYDLVIKYFNLAAIFDSGDCCIGNAVFESREKFLQAIRYLEKAIVLDPYSEKLYLLVGLCFRGCGLQENARAFYKKLFCRKFQYRWFLQFNRQYV
jgi:tetratricopeptide (TPR) repeat protein